MQGKEPADK